MIGERPKGWYWLEVNGTWGVGYFNGAVYRAHGTVWKSLPEEALGPVGQASSPKKNGFGGP